MTDESGGGIQPDSPVCQICSTQVQARTGNTSNLLSHFEKKTLISLQSWDCLQTHDYDYDYNYAVITGSDYDYDYK